MESEIGYKVLKEKDMEESEVSVGCTNLPEQLEVKVAVVLGFLKSNRMDKSPGPDEILPILLRDKIGDGRALSILVSSLLQTRSWNTGE